MHVQSYLQMNSGIRILVLMIIMQWRLMEVYGQPNQPIEKYTRIINGTVEPAGWIKNQMKKDMNGFVGNLDMLVPDLFTDSIYGADRIHGSSAARELGNNTEENLPGSEQYMWWNSETQSNWWDGYIRYAFLLKDEAAIAKVHQYVYYILSTQDTDGYIGIYKTDLRYNFHSENGELWSKTTLYRGLLAYYEFTGDKTVWNAIVRAVDNVMENYPINNSNPFNAGKEFSGGVAHGLTFTDVLDEMYLLSGDKKYREYANFIYHNFSDNYSSEPDAQLKNLLNNKYRLKAHGVHTYEHLRPVLVAYYASGDPELKTALQKYVYKIQNVTTPTGGAIGDEWILERFASAEIGYEYCSLQELMHSCILLMQKTGNMQVADVIEDIFYNAAQGSRDPEHSAIAYLKTDNSFAMMGGLNDESNKNQTRYKYSPAHQDVAVCCNPNAGRITPYFIQNAWMQQGDSVLVAALLGPNVLDTKVNGIDVRIEIVTDYPYTNTFKFKISSYLPVSFQLKIHKPEWVSGIRCSEQYFSESDMIDLGVFCNYEKSISLEYNAEVKVKTNTNNEHYFTYGALVYAYPIPAKMETGREYAPGFTDIYYAPLNATRYNYTEEHNAKFINGKIEVQMINASNKNKETISLIPLSKTTLRQAAF